MTLVEFERSEIERLLGLLDVRLQKRGVPASVYVVGGAAIAVTVHDARRTIDIDALVSDRVVLEEAELLAESEGIPRSWLNENARPWVPPRPLSATVPLTRPGLTIHWAPADHLLAMKLVSMRPQDVPDIVALSKEVGLGTDAAAYADLLERVYEGEGVLEQLLQVTDGEVRAEALHRGNVAARLVRDAEG
ncbi:DUF6036 family nucleotidyltransferase [Terrabacter sp. RAF57]|uniref:DUF6036 family nucleotidyltransferase n=1 Tax=Terrabacter sp. RAF57 TaxID=3233063 RepID=UPI003F9D6901